MTPVTVERTQASTTGIRRSGRISKEIDFWRMEFPLAEALPKDLIAVTLECTGCRRQTSLQFDATEMDVYTVNEGSLR